MVKGNAEFIYRRLVFPSRTDQTQNKDVVTTKSKKAESGVLVLSLNNKITLEGSSLTWLSRTQIVFDDRIEL